MGCGVCYRAADGKEQTHLKNNNGLASVRHRRMGGGGGGDGDGDD